jgi:hypothetical protein
MAFDLRHIKELTLVFINPFRFKEFDGDSVYTQFTASKYHSFLNGRLQFLVEDRPPILSEIVRKVRISFQRQHYLDGVFKDSFCFVFRVCMFKRALLLEILL